MKKTFCHCLVGFSITEYFKNLIISTIELDKISDILVITTGNPRLLGWGGSLDIEFKENIKIEKFVNEIKLKYNKKNIYYIDLENKSKEDNKVGSLYDAYNLALDFCYKKNIDYMNIIQNDSQFMLWSENLKMTIIDILESQEDVFFINSGFLRKAVHYDFNDRTTSREIYLKNYQKNKKIYLSKESGMGDWGVFDLNKLKSLKFIFLNNEDYMSKKYLKEGYKLVYSPIPFVTLIPWPITIRNKRIHGWVLPFKNKKYLTLSEGIDEKTLLENEPLWKEDCVKTVDWWSLEPNWVTDLNFEYFETILKNYKNKNYLNSFVFTEKSNKRYFYPPSIFKPYRPSIFLIIFSIPLYIIHKLIFKILKLFN